MARGVQRYISNSLDKKIKRIQKELKYNNNVKGSKTYRRACDILARNIK